MSKYKLFGMPASLYMGKARSYMRKQGIPFIEYGANHPDYQTRIMPAVGRFIIPVLETPEGHIVQDGADIIDYLEASDTSDFSVYPDSAVLKTVALLFELFGGEGLLRPAMHYRWNFDDTNIDFVRNEFIAGLAPVGATAEQGDALFDMSSGRMRNAAVNFGVSEAAKPLIESSYAEFLSLFAAHLKDTPYLVGGRPSIGDFGLVTALYAHLNRDPAPMLLMRQQAPEVSRWVERMNASGDIWVEHKEDYSWLADSPLPDTLLALMRYVADEYLPELSAQVAFANEWLEARPDLEAGTNGVDNPANRYIGDVEFPWRGITLKTSVLPYRFYLMQRVQDSYAAASEVERTSIKGVFESTGLGALLEMKTHRRIERVNHLEVWGESLG